MDSIYCTSYSDHSKHFRQLKVKYIAQGHINKRREKAEIKPTMFQLQDNYSTH